MEQPALASGSLRSDSVRLLPSSVFIGGAERGRSGAETRNLRSAILRSRRWLGGIDPRLDRRLAAAGLACGQPAVVGMGAGDVAAGDAGPAGAAAAGLASASAVVVTGPAELPFSQADQDSCQ